MRLSSLKITHGFFEKTFEFDSSYNLIFSKKNSVGKTTLLRSLLYALGFNIPNTKNFKMENCKFELKLTTDTNKKYILLRQDSYCKLIDSNNNELHFSLPANTEALHSKIFEIENNDILENILGAMYLDQEKGWTLLNRGIVIGSIRFNLDKFIQGVSNIDCSSLYEELIYIENQIKKYRSMLSIASYQNQIKKISNIIEFDSYNDKIEKEIAILEFEKKPLVIEQERLNNVLKKNIEFKKYITDMKLHVVDNNGNKIPVNEKTIDGFRDNINFITAKINIINSKIAFFENKIKTYKRSQKKENLLFETDTETLIDKFDADISKIKIDYIAVESMIKQLESKQKNIKAEINRKTKSNNTIISDLHESISKYAKEMGVDEKYIQASNDYIFTSDLKSLSGAIFHKIVFAFKLSYIAILKKYTNIVLPIILDSPRGKEVDDVNIEKMVEILTRDFSQHQIIIASIFNYNIKDLNIIELKNCLLENFDNV